MQDNIKASLLAIGTGVAGLLTAMGLNVDFLSTEILTGIASAVAAVVGFFIGKKIK